MNILISEKEKKALHFAWTTSILPETIPFIALGFSQGFKENDH
jgi:hypothetical protein